MSGEPPEAREQPAPAASEPEPAVRPPPRRLELVLDSHPPPEPTSSLLPEVVREPTPVPSAPVDAPPIDAASDVGRVPIAPTASAPFGAHEERMIRSLAGWLGLTAVATLGVCGVLGAQWAQGHGSVPSAVAAVLTGAVGLWTLLAGWHLGRVVRAGHDDAHELVSAFGNLRSILILKAIGLFLVLGLSCFAFSIVASLLALL